MSIDKQESIDVAELLYGIVKEEVDKLNEVKPQDTPAIDITTNPEDKKKLLIADLDTEEGKEKAEWFKRGWLEGYRHKEDIDKEMKIEEGDIDFMYKWIRSKSGK